jgi:homoserine dehydrogenase
MKQVHVALLGLGNVGRAFAEYCITNRPSLSPRIVIRAVADSTGGLVLDSDDSLECLIAHKVRGGSVAEFSRSKVADANQFITSISESGVTVLVESLPTNIKSGQPALHLITLALSLGLNVVTVDKGPLVHGFDQLREAAGAGGSRFAFSGTTGVTIPDELWGEQILEIAGVLNGTSNHLLTEMQDRGLPFDEALAQAQAQGIAEPDPSLDTEGWDTAAKILILAKSLMNTDASLADVSRRGLDGHTQALIGTARANGKAVRLVGRALQKDGQLRVTVAPEMVAADSPFYSVRGTTKLAVFKTMTREVASSSRSGRHAISQTIVDDIVRVLHSI